VGAEATKRPVWAEIDLDAVRHNVGVLRRLAAPADLCAVVKADAYGHGAVPVSTAAVAAGATRLGVAVVEEGVELRGAGITAPVIVLSEPAPEAMPDAIANGLEPTLYTAGGIDAAERAVPSAGRATAFSPVTVHVKVDTGMHRVGADASEALELVRRVNGSRKLRLGSVWTHLAVADGTTDEDREYTTEQLQRYEEVLAVVESSSVEVPLRHAANSAGAIAHPRSRYGMVRCGIALYGEAPSPELAPVIAGAGETLRPVMSLKARVTLVKELAAGERPSYGRRRALGEDSVVATVPIGYADGVPRAWFEKGGSVLIGGESRQLAGTVTMDQIVVDCGPVGRDPKVSVGDEVVLIGCQQGSVLGASEWAERLGTISYEVLCGIGPRVPRVYLGLPDPGRGSVPEFDETTPKGEQMTATGIGTPR
jgi:alanine racemase